MGDTTNKQAFDEEFAAALTQIASSAEEIHRTAESEEKSITVIRHNLNEATLELKELNEDIADQSSLAKEIFVDIDTKIDAVQEAAEQSGKQAEKAEAQKPMFKSIEKMISTSFDFMTEMQEEIIDLLHVVAINAATKAGHVYASTEQLGGVLKAVSKEIQLLLDKATEKMQRMTREIKPYIETSKRLAVTNEEFFLSAQNAAKQMEQIMGKVQEIRVGSEGTAGMIEDLKNKTEKITKNISNIDFQVMEFAGSVTQTKESIGEIQSSIVGLSEEYHKKDTQAA